jgi:chromosome segregation ATPase
MPRPIKRGSNILREYLDPDEDEDDVLDLQHRRLSRPYDVIPHSGSPQTLRSKKTANETIQKPNTDNHHPIETNRRKRIDGMIGVEHSVDEDEEVYFGRQSYSTNNNNKKTPPPQPSQLRSDENPDAIETTRQLFSPFSPLNPRRRRQRRRQHSRTIDWKDEAQADLSLSVCRKVSVVVQVIEDEPQQQKEQQQVCLFPLHDPNRNPSSSPEKSLLRNKHDKRLDWEDQEQVIPSRDIVVVNPDAFGKFIPSKITMDTARMVAQLAHAESEDWTRIYKFNQVLWNWNAVEGFHSLAAAVANDVVAPGSIAQRVIIQMGKCRSREGVDAPSGLFGIVGQQSVARVFAAEDTPTTQDILHRYGLVGLTVSTMLSKLPHGTRNVANVSAPDETKPLDLTLSVLEISDEEMLHDLLANKPFAQKAGVQIRRLEQGFVVTGLSESPIQSLKQLGHCIRRAFAMALHKNRRMGRGHIVATVSVGNTMAASKRACVQFVDLANVQSTGNDPKIARRNAAIRKSKALLGSVLRASLLKEAGNDTVVSFRETLLTKVLQRSMAQIDSKAIVLATVSSSTQTYEETMSTLRYVSRLLFAPNMAPQSPFKVSSSSAVDSSTLGTTSPTVSTDQSSSAAAFSSLAAFEGQERLLLEKMVSDPRQRLAKAMKSTAVATTPRKDAASATAKARFDLSEEYDYTPSTRYADPRDVSNTGRLSKAVMREQESLLSPDGTDIPGDWYDIPDSMPTPLAGSKKGQNHRNDLTLDDFPERAGHDHEPITVDNLDFFNAERETDVSMVENIPSYDLEQDFLPTTSEMFDATEEHFNDTSQDNEYNNQDYMDNVEEEKQNAIPFPSDPMFLVEQDPVLSSLDGTEERRRYSPSSSIEGLEEKRSLEQILRHSSSNEDDLEEPNHDGELKEASLENILAETGSNVDGTNDNDTNTFEYDNPSPDAIVKPNALSVASTEPLSLADKDNSRNALLDERDLDELLQSMDDLSSSQLERSDGGNEDKVDDLQFSDHYQEELDFIDHQLVDADDVAADSNLVSLSMEQVVDAETQYDSPTTHAPGQRIWDKGMGNAENATSEFTKSSDDVKSKYGPETNPALKPNFDSTWENGLDNKSPNETENEHAWELLQPFHTEVEGVHHEKRKNHLMGEAILSPWSSNWDKFTKTQQSRVPPPSSTSHSTKRNVLDEIEELQSALDKVKQTNMSVWQSSLNSIEKLRQFQSSQQNAMHRLTLERDEAKSQIELLKEDIERERRKYHQERMQLESALSSAKTNMEKLKVERSEVVKIAEEAIGTQAELEQKVSELEVRIASQIATSVPVDEYNALEESNAFLEQNVRALQDEIVQYKTQLSERNVNIAELQLTLKTFENEQKRLTDVQVQYRKEIEQLRAKLDESFVAECDAAALRSENEHLRQELRTTISKSCQQEADLLRDIKTKEAHITLCEENIERLKETLVTTEDLKEKETSALRTQVQDLRDELHRSVEKETNYLAEIEHSKQQVSNIMLENEVLSDEFQKTRDALSQRVADIEELSQNIKAFMSEKEQDKSKIARMEKSLEDFQRETRSRVEKVVRHRNEAASLLEKTLAENKKLMETNEKLQAAISDMKARHRDVSDFDTSKTVRRNAATLKENYPDFENIRLRQEWHTRGANNAEKLDERHQLHVAESRRPSFINEAGTRNNMLDPVGGSSLLDDRLHLQRAEEVAAFLALTAKSNVDRNNAESKHLKQQLYALEDEKDAEISSLKVRIRALERRLNETYK